MAGPDLAHVTERRSHDWLKRWLKAPETMFGADSVVDAMVVAAKNVKMPNMKLNDSDIDALMNYFSSKAATTRRDE
jgi:cbb3-type cytochrome oxidase cytochrome c subunit